MPDNLVTIAHRSLHGQLAAAWRRSAQALPKIAHRTGLRFVAPIVALLAVGAMALVVSFDAAAAAATADAHGDALRDLRAQRYASAYRRFADLADAGDAPAALMALVMVCDGGTLFGSAWSATPGQLQRWNMLAARELRDRSAAVAQYEPGDE